MDNFKGKELVVGQNRALVTRKSANEYTYSKIHVNLTSKMKAATELDNLLKVAKYKYSKPDDGRHNFAKDGWEYYETKFKICNDIYTGLINIAKNNNKRIFYDITKIKRNT